MSSLIRTVLLALIGFAVLVGIVVGYREGRDWYAGSVAKRKSAEIRAESQKLREGRQHVLSNIRAADKVTDPMQRCLKFPDPPSIHWNGALVAEMCRLSTLKLVTMDEIAARFSRGDVDSVDATFDEYATQNAADPSKRGILFRAFETLFDSENPEVGAVVESWVKHAPRSANALAARGIFRVRNGYEARGTESARETPAENMKAMRRWLELGIADLESSLRINPRFVVPATYLIYAHRSEGDQEVIATSGNRAVGLGPAEYRTYIFWLTSAAPLWGGSIDNLHAIVEVAKPHVADNPLLALANARALLLERRALHGQLTRADYLDVLAIAPDEWALKETGLAALGDDSVATLSQLVRFAPTVANYVVRSEQLALFHQADWAKEDATRAAEIGSPMATDLAAYAHALRAIGKSEPAAAAFEKILENNPRNAKAMQSLAQLYQGELHRHDDAVAMAQRYVDAYPDSQSSWGTMAYVTKGSDIPKYCDAMSKYYGADVPTERWDTGGECGGARHM